VSAFNAGIPRLFINRLQVGHSPSDSVLLEPVIGNGDLVRGNVAAPRIWATNAIR